MAPHPPAVPHQTRPRQPTRPTSPPPPPPPSAASSSSASTSTPSRLYRYQSSAVPPSLTTHWHQAAALTQGQPEGQARVLVRQRKRRPKATAYAIIRGKQIGVWDTWLGPDGAEQHTRGYRFALYTGFSSRKAAQAAFDFCEQASWTCSLSVISSMPVPLHLIPKPVENEHDLQGHVPRAAGDWWYVVFVGVHPGVYPSSVESLLNVLGVKNSSHDSWPTYQEARREYEDAFRAGHCVVRNPSVF
ncbi:hypothetical protein C8F01DRAFT_1176381 [Mycena amicta]|nr:hypothetical protein C8F01DRAFT_1176381 [Mycena amicta]